MKAYSEKQSGIASCDRFGLGAGKPGRVLKKRGLVVVGWGSAPVGEGPGRGERETECKSVLRR